MSGSAEIRIIGPVRTEPEMRFTAAGKAVTTFKIPVQERKDGETTWYKIVSWEKQAETLNQFVNKGTWLAIDGVPSVETWEDKTSGETRVQLVVTVRKFTFVGDSKRDDSESTPAAQRAQAPRNAPIDLDESALPF